MKRQSMAIIAILATGSLFGTIYATSTVISDSGIITQNLTVLGSCSGCGGDGNFNSYATLTNTTITPSNISTINLVQVGTNGSAIYVTRGFDFITLDSSQTIITDDASSNSGLCNTCTEQTSMSVNGKYKVFASESDNGVYVIKNNSILQKIGIDKSQCSGGNLQTMSIGISSDGKYIMAICEDSGFASDRVLVFRGS